MGQLRCLRSQVVMQPSWNMCLQSEQLDSHTRWCSSKAVWHIAQPSSSPNERFDENGSSWSSEICRRLSITHAMLRSSPKRTTGPTNTPGISSLSDADSQSVVDHSCTINLCSIVRFLCASICIRFSADTETLRVTSGLLVLFLQRSAQIIRAHHTQATTTQKIMIQVSVPPLPLLWGDGDGALFVLSCIDA
jgi:hypothetical protein